MKALAYFTLLIAGTMLRAEAQPTNTSAVSKQSAVPLRPRTDLEWQQRYRAAKVEEKALVKQIHQKIISLNLETTEAAMNVYTNEPHANVYSVMMPIKGSEFIMGSPESETGHKSDESPQHRVKVAPFWMQQCEVTWDEYEPFMLNVDAEKFKDAAYVPDAADAVAKPTKPYVELSFGMGKRGFPAVAMTQHAANKYCQWLSAKTGHFYRLPTEAEWEYACRAGTTTAYSFGDDPKQLGEYAWFRDNSETPNGDSWYRKVGRKKPNGWGLHDMYGNVAEWCLDQYDAAFYREGEGRLTENPWNKATIPYPHVVRGGAWEKYGAAEELRSAARHKSDRAWKTDPLLPPTFWYVDAAPFVGFRIVRPLKVPSAEEMFKYWNSGVERDLIR